MTIESSAASGHPVLRGALGFSLGGVLILPLMLTDQTPSGPLIPILGFFLPGVIGPLALAPYTGGWWGAIRAGLGFGFGSLFAGLSFILMMFTFPKGIAWMPCLGIGFGLAGASGGAFLALGWRIFFRSAAGFAIGGLLGGLALLVIEPPIETGLRHLLGSSQWSSSVNTVAFVSFGVAGILLPYMVGGALLGRSLAEAGKAKVSP